MLIVQHRSDRLGRIIKTGSASKDRIWFEKGIVISIRELVKQSERDRTTYDLVAFIALSLKAIGDNVEESVIAWEKRGYWVKADRYRMEWNWTTRIGDELLRALCNEDWGDIASIIAQVSQKMRKVNLPKKNRIGAPWVGSWDRLISTKNCN
jgi:hypothetical protein